MKLFVAVILWAILFALYWPIALFILIAWPFLWLLSLPFRIVGTLMQALLAFLKAILFLPSRLLGERRGKI